MATGFTVKNRSSLKGGVVIGGGTLLKKARVATGTFVFGTIATVSAKEASLADANVGTADIILAMPPATGSAPALLDDAILMGVRAAAGTVIAKIYNPTAGNLVQGSVTLTYLHIQL